MNRGVGLAVSLSLAVVGIACAGHDTGSSIADQGGERQPCYPNGTCNSGLSCLSDVCVKVNLDGGGPQGVGEVGVDGAPTPPADGMVEPPGDGDRPRRPPFDAAPTAGY